MSSLESSTEPSESAPGANDSSPGTSDSEPSRESRWDRAVAVCPWITKQDEVYPLPEAFLAKLQRFKDKITDDQLDAENQLNQILCQYGVLFNGRYTLYKLWDEACDFSLKFEQLKDGICCRSVHCGSNIWQGVGTQRAENFVKDFRKLWEDIWKARTAYAGWLITQSTFRDEVNELKEQWGRRFEELECFPSIECETGPALSRRETPAEQPYIAFCVRWSLDRMATWTLPEPLDIPLTGFGVFDYRLRAGAGTDIFLPTYLWRRKTVGKLAERLAGCLSKLHNTDHLEQWLDVRRGHFERYTQVFLYVYLRKALGQRPWGAALKTGQKDAAICEFLGCSADTLKRCRNKIPPEMLQSL